MAREKASETGPAIAVSCSHASMLLAIEGMTCAMRVIRQNLAWAFGYNVVLIPLAILSPLVPLLLALAPVLAAAAMACSPVLVVSNALRLRHA